MGKLIKRSMGSDICLHELKIVIGCVLFVICAIHSVIRHINPLICEFYANGYVKLKWPLLPFLFFWPNFHELELLL